MWVYLESSFEPIPGTEGRDYTDPEFDELEAAYAVFFGCEPGALAESGRWHHEAGGPRVKHDEQPTDRPAEDEKEEAT